MRNKPTVISFGIVLLLVVGVSVARALPLDRPSFTVPLPFSGSTTSSGAAFAISNNGSGPAGLFRITTNVSANPALLGRTASTATGASGVYGEVTSASPGSSSAAVRGVNNGTGIYGIGVWGSQNGAGYGVYGTSNSGAGVIGYSATGPAVVGSGSRGDAIQGFAIGANTVGVYGTNTSGGYGVVGRASGSNPAVWAENTGGGYGLVATSRNGAGNGLYAEGANFGGWIIGRNVGLHVESVNDGIDVSNTALYKSSVFAHHEGPNYGYGVFGVTDVGVGVYGNSGNGWAGYYDGNVRVNGALSVTGAKSFVIDHPQDPANKYLYHAAVESPDLKNIYDGTVVTNAQGNATVTLPSYFQALNQDFRYQLTVVGQFAQAIVSKEISNNRFVIKTDKPNVKVSWQVTGIRRDAYAKAHPMQVEVEKSDVERGKYLTPTEHGQPASMGVGYESTRRDSTSVQPQNPRSAPARIAPSRQP